MKKKARLATTNANNHELLNINVYEKISIIFCVLTIIVLNNGVIK